MSIKGKIRTILADSLHRFDVKSAKDRVLNRGIVKNIIIDDDQLPLELESQRAGGFIRILATGPDNAKQISSILKQNKDELGIKSVEIVDKVLKYKQKTNEEPIFHTSVLVRTEPKTAIGSTLSCINSEDYLRKEIRGNDAQSERVVIDFSSPNIAKPFHFGHLKSTILGNYLANLNKFVGNNVTKINYVGDWGTQYGLLSLGLDEFGSLEVAKRSPLRYLLDIYVKANERGKLDPDFYTKARQRFLELEDGSDCELLSKWNMVRDLSLKELKESYNRLGVEFDVMDCESGHAKKAYKLVQEMKSKNIARELEDGVICIDIEKNNKMIQVPLLKSDGASLYVSRDVATAIDRKTEYDFDRMLYVVGADQEKHFHSLREIIRKLGYDWADRLIHVKMGKVVGMSSRSGNVVLLSDIIDEVTRRYIESTKGIPTSKATSEHEIEEIGKHLALACLFVYDLRNRRTNNYEFDYDLVVMDGQRSGIQLQVCHSRLFNLVEKARRAGIEPLQPIDKVHPEAFRCLEAIHLVSLLDEFDSELHDSYHLMEPRTLVNHGLQLSKFINKARQSPWLQVLQEPQVEVARCRLTLFEVARKQLEFIIKMIGLKPLERT